MRAALLAAALALPAAAPAQAADVPAERALYADAPNGLHLLESGWSTRPDPEDRGLDRGWQRPGAASGFRSVAVPHAFNTRPLSESGFRSRVQWYRTRFDLPDATDATGWKLRFESVNMGATAWLNGRKLGAEHRGAHLPFELPATGIRPGENELVVRVDGRLRPTDLPPSTRERGWWNYGGILREVYLRKVRSFDLADLQVQAGSGTPSRVEVSAMVRNTSGTAQSLDYMLNTSGPGFFSLMQPGSQGTVAPNELVQLSASFDIPAPMKWSPDSPSLYEISLTLPGGQVVRTHFAVRDWSVGADGRALLNGRRLSLRGASFHEQTPSRGWALRPADREEIVRELKALGADFTRQHYPPHPALLEAFDREGIVFWEQIPVWRMRDRQLRGRIRTRALSELRQAVLRDRNHASVMAWSVANETLRGGSSERSYLSAARSLVRRLDPTRLVAADKSLRPLDDVPRFYSLLDAVGLNEYVGWYGGRNSQLPRDLRAVRRRLPGQALFITEFGAEANRAGPASRKGTFAFQSRFLHTHLGYFTDSGELSGALVWALRDFACRPGWKGGNPRPRPPYNEKGIFDRRGRPKPAFETVKADFAAVPALAEP